MELSTWLVLYIVGSALAFYLVAFLLHGRRTKCTSQRRLDGQTAIVTGGSSGIGRATAANLAVRGAKVIIGSSQSLKGSVAAQQIRGESENADVLYYELDLGDTNSIREFACHIYNTEPRLDILVNNAGISQHYNKTTADGYEVVFGVNYIGHFLLTYLLLDLMKQSGGGRIVNVSSMSHTFVVRGLDFSIYEPKINHLIFPYLAGYETSKLALVVMAREVARRYADDNIRANACHPGLVLTRLWDSTGETYGRIIFKLFKLILLPFLLTPEQACQTVVYCAADEHMENVSGKFVQNCHVQLRENHHAADPHIGSKLWDLSLFMTGCSKKLSLRGNLTKRLDPKLKRRTALDLQWWEVFSHKETDPEEKMEIKRK